MTALDYFALVDPRFYDDDLPIYVNELVNLKRTQTYLQAGMHPPSTAPATDVACSTLSFWLDQWNADEGGATYQTPAVDNAPWYDPTRPASALFAGVLVTEVDGLQFTPDGRDPTPRPDGGSYMGRSAFVHRVLTFEAVLIGRTCCATAAGYRWLSRSLAGKRMSECDGFDLWFLECCPNDTDSSCLPGGPDETPTGGNTPWLFTTDVALLEGVQVIENAGASCGSCGCSPLLRVEFTLGAGNPYFYGKTVTEYDTTGTDDFSDNYPAAICAADIGEITWGESTDCSTIDAPDNPYCSTSLPPAVAPDIESCLCTPFATFRQTPITSFTTSEVDRVPRVTISAPDAEAHHLAVRIGDGDCTTIEPCDWDSGFAITYLPQGSTLVYDAARRTISLTLDDGTTLPASEYIYSLDGVTNEWPVIGWHQSMCLSVDVDAFDMPLGLEVKVETVDRLY